MNQITAHSQTIASENSPSVKEGGLGGRTPSIYILWSGTKLPISVSENIFLVIGLRYSSIKDGISIIG